MQVQLNCQVITHAASYIQKALILTIARNHWREQGDMIEWIDKSMELYMLGHLCAHIG